MGNTQITFTYLNIRQSIVILLAKIILVDILSAFLVVGSYVIMIQGITLFGYTFIHPYLFLALFTTMGISKILVNIYTVLQWLYEYYEITPEYIIHKRGFIFRNTEKYRIDQIRAIKVQDTLLGELFNYATVSIYDMRLNKGLALFQIHNPHRYAEVLRELLPHLEMKEERVAIPMPMPGKRGSNHMVNVQ